MPSFVKAQGNDCSTATQLTNVINFCSGAGAYTNVGSNASGFGNASCVTPAGATEDVWFSFTAVGTDVLISAAGAGAGGTMVRPRIAIYSGSCAGTINELGCANGTGSGSGVTQLYEGALNPGVVYLIRISTTNSQEGTFELCVNNYTPAASPGADCGGAAFLCSESAVSIGSLSGGGANNHEPELTSCIADPSDPGAATEGNSSWFYWTCGTSGTLTLDLTPVNPTDDIDFILYQLAGTNVCGPRTILRCSAASDDCGNANGQTGLNLTETDISEEITTNGIFGPDCHGGNGYVQYINMVAGTTYAILVNNYSTGNGFTMSFGGTGTFLGPDPNISTSATTICAGQTVSFDGTSSTNVGGGLSWNFLNGGSPTSATGVGPHTVTYSTPGTYVAILNGTDGVGCASVEVANITVSNATAAPTATAPSYCQGATASALTAVGTNLLWYTALTGGVGSALAPTPSTATVGTTTYYVSQTPSGCESPRTAITVTVTAGPDATATTPVNLNCVPTTVQLSGSSTAVNPTYSWSGPGIVSGGNTATPTVNGSGTYVMTVTVGQCTNTASVTVNAPSGSPELTLISGNTLLTCAVTSATLNSSSSTANVGFQWTGPTAGNIISNTASGTATAPGTYTITVTDNSNGCTSVNSVQITSNITPPTVNPIAAQTLTCITTTVTISTSNTAGYNYSWTGPTAGTPAGTTPAAFSTVVNAAGTYTITVTNPTNGCSGNTTALINNSVTPPTVTMGTNQAITCAANSVSISGSGASQIGGSVAYVWTGPTVGSPAGTTPSSSTTSVAAPGTYTLTVVEQTNGCNVSGTVSVTASTDLPQIASGPNDTLTCLVNTVNISGSSTTPGVTYAWTGPTLGDPAGTTPTATSTQVNSAGTYTLTVTDPTNSCSSSVQVLITTDLTAPQLSVGASPLLSCAVTTVPLTASSITPNVTYSWTGPSSGSPAGNTPTNDTTTVSAAGTYSIVVTNPLNGCTNNSTVLVNSNGSQTIVNAGSATITLPCGSAGVTIVPQQQQTGYTYSWTGPFGAVIPNPTSFNPGSVNVAGTYYLTALNPATGCTSIDSVKLIPGVAPNANFSPSVNSGYLPLPVVYSNTSTGGNSYQWFVSGSLNGLPVAFTTSYANTFTAPGTYTVMLVAGNGNSSCNDTTFSIIEVKEYATVVIPNIFSPNGDNLNDELKPIATGMKDLNIDIFNRWGQKIITFNGLTKGWDGTGSSEGTYYYIAKGMGEDGTEIEQKGYVLMVK